MLDLPIAILLSTLTLLPPQEGEGKPAPKPKAEPAPQEQPKDGPQDGPKTPKVEEEAGQPEVKRLVVPRPRAQGERIPSYRVQVWLPSGRRFTGIVTRDLRFHHHMVAEDHRKAAQYQSPEHFTLRFLDGHEGEIALAWNQVQKLEVREILDLAGLKAMQRSLVTARVASRARAKSVIEDMRDREKGAAAPAGKPGKGKDDKRPALLQRFPPEQGWGPQRQNDLVWRKNILGLFPDDEEQAFLDSYDRWLETLAKWQEEHPAEPDGKRPPAGPVEKDPPEKVPDPGAEAEGGKPPAPPPPEPPARDAPGDGKSPRHPGDDD